MTVEDENKALRRALESTRGSLKRLRDQTDNPQFRAQLQGVIDSIWDSIPKEQRQ